VVPVSVLHGKHLFNSRGSRAPFPASGSVGGQDRDATLFQFQLETEDSQNFSSGQPSLPPPSVVEGRITHVLRDNKSAKPCEIILSVDRRSGAPGEA
jgi:hypothetical protein